MVTYKERKENTRVFVLIKSGEVLGCWGNLKNLCESQEDPTFPSYWTLTRKKEDVIEFGEYSLHKVKLY